MGELIRGTKTPEIPGASDRAETGVHSEAHEETFAVEANEGKVTETRDFILQKYNIPRENIIIQPVIKDSRKKQRKIRAFSLLQNSENPELSFYAEGHTAHVALNRLIVNEFGEKMRIENMEDLIEDETLEYKKPWVYRKGFLDPLHNSFKDFPSIHESLLKQLRRNQEINGVNEEQMIKIENGEQELPNWFLSADSSQE